MEETRVLNVKVLEVGVLLENLKKVTVTNISRDSKQHLLQPIIKDSVHAAKVHVT